MGCSTSLLLAALLAGDPNAPRAESASSAEKVPNPSNAPAAAPPADQEAKNIAGVAPVELIPRLELRQSFVRLGGGLSAHVTTAEIDIAFLRRVMLRYQGPIRVLSGPTGQISGFGDSELQAVGLLASSQRFVAVAIAGAVFDTASQPELGAGKTQLVFGGAAAISPVRWWLPYLIVQEQFSVAGAAARPDINVLVVRAGNIVFGPGFSWYKLDFDGVTDFESEKGRLFGQLEVGSLLVGRTGLFMRGGTQLVGTRQLDYSMEVGVRYLFRLNTGRP
jgi:hypothetical protein